MLKVIKEDTATALIIRLYGTLDEQSNLDELIGAPTQALHVYCREVARINSLGIRVWVKYFQKLENANIPMKFLELSPILVHQLNLMVNFIPLKAELVSTLAPYLCMQCKCNSVGLFKVADMKTREILAPKLKCPKCSGVCEFDDIESDYFAFVARR